MEYFEDDKNNLGKTYGAIATLLYAAVWVILLLLVNFNFGGQNQFGEGILIAFGNSDSGFGPDDLPLADVFTQSGSSGGSSGRSEAILTQDYEEAPAVRQQPPTTTQQQGQSNQTAQQQGNNNQNTQSTTEEPRTADPRALFPGRTEGSEATSQGIAGGAGNQGNPAGSPGGDPAGTGLGSSGVGFDLSGRSVRGSLPLPTYVGNSAGRVIITINVNGAGNVTSATYRAQGSTTSDRQLIDAALAVARRATFSEADAVSQTGTITYDFILR